MSAGWFFRADGVSPCWGVGPGCDAGPFSVGWSPLASAGVVTVVVLRWITLWSCGQSRTPSKRYTLEHVPHSGPLGPGCQALRDLGAAVT